LYRASPRSWGGEFSAWSSAKSKPKDSKATVLGTAEVGRVVAVPAGEKAAAEAARERTRHCERGAMVF